MTEENRLLLTPQFKGIIEKLEGRKFPETEEKLADLLVAVRFPVAKAQDERTARQRIRNGLSG